MHVTPYVTDFGASLGAVIDSSKDLTSRIHAGLGVIDYGVCTFDLGGNHACPPCPDCTEAELCAKIKAAIPADGPGMKAVDWSKVWGTVKPLLLLLLSKLLG